MKLYISVSIFALTSFGMAVPAWAQSSDGLDEIIVVATKRAENLQDVPLAVSAVTAEQLTNQGIFETSDLNHSAPNLQVSSPYGQQQPNFSIRGVGVGTEFNANAASPVGVYVDEVYQSFRASHGQQLYDLQQIEVLRGPQGTLYGRNTTGGAVNFLTNRPELGGTNGYVSLGYGDYDRKSIEGAFEFTPVEGELGVRIAGTYLEADNYINNATPAGDITNSSTYTSLFAGAPTLATGIQPGGPESYGVRGTVRYNPSDKYDFTLKAYTAKFEAGTEAPIASGAFSGTDLIYRPSTLLNNFLPAFGTHFVAGTGNTVSLADAFSATPGAASYSNQANGLGELDVHADSIGTALTSADGITLRGEVQLKDNLKAIYIGSYDESDYEQQDNTECDASFIRLCSIGYDSSSKSINQDLRFDYTGDKLDLIIGGYYGNDEIKAVNNPDFFGALSLFNAAGGISPEYTNPAGIFSNGINPVHGSLLPPTIVNGVPVQFPMPTGIQATQRFTQKRESWAIYGEGKYALSDDINLTLGLRYTDDTNKFTDGLTTYFNDAGQASLITVSSSPNIYFLRDLVDEAGNVVRAADTGPAPAPLSLKSKTDNVSGRLILDWKPSDNTMLYAGFSRGYRAGTYNFLAYQSTSQVYFVPPEEVDAYEAGFKTRFLDNRLQLNGSVFYYDYTGQQGQVVDSTATANLIALDGKLQGLELEAIFAPSDRLTLSAALGLLDSEYDDGDCSVAFEGQQNGNCVLSAAGPVNVGGNSFPFAAESSVNLAADWDVFEFGSNNEFEFKLHWDGNYTGDFHYDSFGDYSGVPRIPLLVPVPNPITGGLMTDTALVGGVHTEGGGDFFIHNARATIERDNISLAFWVKNISDKVHYPYGIAIEYLFGNDYRVRNAPRTYGAELTYRF